MMRLPTGSHHDNHNQTNKENVMTYIKPRYVRLSSASSSIQGTKTGLKAFSLTDGNQPSSTTAGAYEVDE
jgi:hypothetical protein